MAPARRGPRTGAAAAPDSRRLPRPPPASPAGGSGRAGADGGGPRGVDGRGARRFPGAPRWGPPQRSPTPPGSGSPRQRSPTLPGSDALCSWNMFYGAAASNQAIPAGGDTSDTAKVTDTAGLFNGASAFNKDISSWAVGSVTNNVNNTFANSVIHVKFEVLSETAFLTRQPCTTTAAASPDPNLRQRTPPPSLAPILTEETCSSSPPSV